MDREPQIAKRIQAAARARVGSQVDPGSGDLIADELAQDMD
jgi:hypothetical protein